MSLRPMVGVCLILHLDGASLNEFPLKACIASSDTVDKRHLNFISFFV